MKFAPVLSILNKTSKLLLVLILITSYGYLKAQSLDSTGWAISSEIEHAIIEPSFPDREYLITDFGATSENALTALQKTIDKANHEGGGKIIIPEGRWFLKGPVHLKSNVHLYISEEAILTFSDAPEDYLPQVLTRWEGTEVFNFSPLIYGYQVHNVAITGKGKINGNAEFGFATWRDKQKEAQERLREMGAQGIPVHQRVFGLEDYLRPSFIQFFGSSQILLEDISIENSPMWVNHFIYSSHITVRGITVKSYRLNNDGIVLDSSTLALIEGNSFSTGDDSIVIKSGRDQDGWRIARPSERIVIKNNYMEGHNALAIGSEMSGGVEHIYMKDNTLGKVESAIYFKSNLDRGGYIRNVYVKNTEVKEADILLRFNTNYHSHRGGNFPAEYQNFVIQNVYTKKARVAIEALGISEKPIETVIVENLEVSEAETAQNIEHVNNLYYRNVTINGRQVKLPGNN